MVAKWVSCSTSIEATPIPGTPDSQSLRWRFISGSFYVCSFCAPHAGIPSDTRIQFWFGRSRQADAPLPWFFGTPPVLPTHCCGAALDIILSSLSLSTPITVHSGLNCCPLHLLSSDHMLCSCRLDIPRAPLSPSSAHSSLLRVHDWSTVVAACHHNLSAWHQSVLALVSGPLPGFPKRASVLDSLFDSFTRILCECASHHSCRCPGSRPRRRQPLWWNDACYHALVARNGSFSSLWITGGSGSFPPLAPTVPQHSPFLQDPLE